MNRIEERLRGGAAELRRASASVRPPGLLADASPRPGWLAAAAAFVVVVAAIGLVPLLGGGRLGPEPGGSTPATTATAPPTTAASTPSTVPSSTPAAECSAAGMGPASSRPELPPAVAATRKGIVAAATACDFATLRSYAVEPLTTSFGGGDFDLLVEWEEQGLNRLQLLVRLLELPHAVRQFEEGPAMYVWPSAFAYDTWDEIPLADLEALLAVYTEEELEQLSGFGSYAGWRVGIDEDGGWRYFVAGD